MDRTKLYLYVMILCTMSGIAFSHYKYKKIYHQRIGQNLIVNWKHVKKILAICMIIFSYYFVITIINAGGLNLSVIRSVNSSDNASSAFQGMGATLLFFMIAQPLFTVISLILIYSVFQSNKPPRKIWIMFIVNVFLFLVTNAGRVFIIILLSFSLSAFFINKNKQIKSKINYKRISVYLIGIFLVLNIMTKSRNSSASETVSFIQQAKEYIGCSIINMDYELKDLPKNASLHCGYYAYGGFLYYPIKFINILTGSKISVPGEDLEYLQEIKLIEYNGRSIMYNALVPNAFYYYYDSGLFGIIVFSLLSGFLIGKYEIRALSGRFLPFALYAIGIYYLIFSPMGSQLWKTYMPMTIVWSIILSKKYIWTKKYQ